MTLELPADSPANDLPWIVTFGPADEDEENWDPVVCGPYERAHALALAQAVVEEEDLLAVVEPVAPHTSVADILADIAESRRFAAEAEDEGFEDEDEEDDEHEGHDHEGHDHGPAVAPTAEELKAGFTRLAARISA